MDTWHLERGPSTLADLAEVPGENSSSSSSAARAASQSADLFEDTIHHRLLCGEGTFDVRGFVETLRGLGTA